MRGSAAFRVAVAPGGALAGPWVQNSLWTAARAVPSLDLRFADNKSLVNATTGQNLVTFTRASSATYVGSDGVIKTAATNEPRFDHNPTTGESLGLLVEEARTNLVLRSEEFNDAAWTKAATSVSANAVVAPDNTLTADKLVEDTANNTHIVQPSTSPSYVSGTVYTYSVFAKAAERTVVQLRVSASATFSASFNLSTGIASQLAANTTASIIAFANGWYRCSITFTATATAVGASRVGLMLNETTSTYTGDGTSGLFAWGAQLEAGAFPTSYIPTVAATVTRAADVASITGSNFSSWYNQTEGTVFSDCVSTFSSTQVLVNIAATAANTATSAISLASNLTSSQKRVRVRDAASADQASLGLGGSSSGSRTRIAAAIKANDFAASLDGGAALTDTTGTVPTVVLMEIGSAPSGVTLGTQLHRRLTCWPVRLPNTSLQAITQP